MAKYEVWQKNGNKVDECQTKEIANDIASVMSHMDPVNDYIVRKVKA